MPDATSPRKQATPAEPKRSVAVFYGGASKHTRAISERVADNLRACGFLTRLHSVWGLEPLDLGGCVAAVIVAPVHQGKHEEAMVNFVKTHRADLDHMPVAFISATLSDAQARSPEDAPDGQVQFHGDVQMVGNPFFAETGWHPSRVSAFAGAISYTHYNFFVRWMMKLLAPKSGAGSGPGAGPGGEQKDGGWDALDVFVNEFARESCAAEDPAATELAEPAADPTS